MPALEREQTSKRSDERTIGGSKPRTLILAGQDRELVPQQHEFHVFRELGPSTPNEQPQDSREGKVSKGEERSRPILPGPANALTAGGSCAVQRFLVIGPACEPVRGNNEPSRDRTGTATEQAQRRRTVPNLPQGRNAADLFEPGISVLAPFHTRRKNVSPAMPLQH